MPETFNKGEAIPHQGYMRAGLPVAALPDAPGSWTAVQRLLAFVGVTCTLIVLGGVVYTIADAHRQPSEQDPASIGERHERRPESTRRAHPTVPAELPADAEGSAR